MKRAAIVLSIMVMTLGLAVQAHADSLSIFGTGRDTFGAFLPAGAVDQNYTITSYPGTVGAPLSAYVENFSPFLPGTVSSGSTLYPDVAGTGWYTYTTSFSLAGYDPATASLVGAWYADDAMEGVYLNGDIIPGTGYQWGWPAYQTFTAASGFQAGTNTLSFVVDQADNYWDYINVAYMTVTTEPASVPEPPIILLLGLGLMGLAGLRRKIQA